MLYLTLFLILFNYNFIGSLVFVFFDLFPSYILKYLLCFSFYCFSSASISIVSNFMFFALLWRWSTNWWLQELDLDWEYLFDPDTPAELFVANVCFGGWITTPFEILDICLIWSNWLCSRTEYELNLDCSLNSFS